MSHKSSIALTVLSLSFYLTSFANGQSPDSSNETVGTELRPGKIVIEEDIWFHFIDEPSKQMHLAHESFLKQEYNTTTNQLRKAGAYLHVAAQHASTETKAALVASESEMKTLAESVEDGSERSAKSLESAFARAEHALAAYNNANARSAFRQRRAAAAGQYLHSAVAHLENGATWTGHKLESDAHKTAEGVRATAEKLRTGSGEMVDEAGYGITWVGEEIEKLGHAIEPHRREDSLKNTAVDK